MKLSMDMQKLQTWVIHLQGFNDRTVQNEMLFFFFVKKKKKKVTKFWNTPYNPKGKQSLYETQLAATTCFTWVL